MTGLIVLGCDFVGEYTNTQIIYYKSPFSVSANVFSFNAILSVFVLSESGFVGEFTIHITK